MFDVVYKFLNEDLPITRMSNVSPEELRRQIPELNPHIFTNFNLSTIVMVGDHTLIKIKKVKHD